MGQITLPSRLNLQTSARDLEFNTALKRIVYPQTVPTPFFYPQSPYARGMRGLGCIPYDYYALQTAFGVENCGQGYTDAQSQYACTQRNAPKLEAIALMAPSYGTCITADMIPGPYTPTPGSAGDTSQSGNPIVVPWGTQPGSGIVYSNPPATYTPPPVSSGGTVAPPSSSAGTYSPTVSFIPSRAGTLYPGDTWQIRIQGGRPSSVVSVTGTQNGVTNTNNMGTTDQNGNWSTSGTIDNSSVGNWFEVWYVGGQMAASPFQFTVASPNSPASTGGTNTPPPSGNTTPPLTGGTTTPPPSSSSSTGMIMGIPENYVLMGAGALVLLMVMGGRR